MELMEMRGSGAMRVENGHELATFCRLCMLLSGASCCCEVEAPSKPDIQTVFAAAMSTKEISINKQRERGNTAREECTRCSADSKAKQRKAKQSNAMQRGSRAEAKEE